MTDITYPLRVLKHKFSRAAVYHEGATIITAGILGTVIGIGGIYTAVDEMEDNIRSDQAPQAMERVNNEMASLTEQKQAISTIRNKIDNLEFTSPSNKSYNLKKQEKRAIYAFKDNAEDTLDYIITNKHLSEQQISELWGNFSDNIATPESIKYKYDNNYDFGFIKEARAEALFASSSQTTAELASNMDDILKSKEDNKAISVFGIFGIFIVFPLMGFIGSYDNKTIRKLADEKPTRRKKINSNFKH